MAVVGFTDIPRLAAASYLPDALGLLIVGLVDHGALHVAGQVLVVDADAAFLGVVEILQQLAVIVDPNGPGAVIAFDLHAINGLTLLIEFQHVGDFVPTHLRPHRLFHIAGKILKAKLLAFGVVAAAILPTAGIDVIAVIA